MADRRPAWERYYLAQLRRAVDRVQTAARLRRQYPDSRLERNEFRRALTRTIQVAERLRLSVEKDKSS